ncbi:MULTISPECIES: dihydroorotate dehydrogenase electron transfer subunit [unclassified Enterococcus]|uniref:dihydroorotate dehydrogenase electron transfer subunit n=1 Tax=unclassified Enterococcus TaxID=2608891 RepID=UPI002474E1A7|nr:MULTISPECIES: dihydroorotate dehydrogenase electron transfer subunit [unclassified Enterococcus]
MKQEMMEIVQQRQLAPRIFEMTLKGQLVQEMQKAGQFIHIRVPRADLLLRRPISLNHVDHTTSTCRIIYRVEGDGTQVFSELKTGAQLDVMGPLGNGFTIDNLQAGDVAFIVGGGIGIPPLYELSKQLIKKGVRPIHFLGYASKEVAYYQAEFDALGETRFATDDGTFGIHGNVGHLLQAAIKEVQPTAVFACGANGMLKAVETTFLGHQNVQLSLEARMACGMGACYACVCHLKDDTTGSKSVKVCDEGPIFQAGKVAL